MHNNHVDSLYMWEDLFRAQNVGVVIFEGEDLESALESLNRLGARVFLDIPSIMGSNGSYESLKRILHRFVFDPGWRSLLFPFDRMFRNAVEEQSVPMINSWGLEYGSFRLAPYALERNWEETEADIISSLYDEERQSLVEWKNKRKACLACSLLDVCGSCLSSATGDPCSSELMEMVSSIRAAANQAKEQMNKAMPEH